jgi:UDP-N-acetylmuramate--alanine ligase
VLRQADAVLLTEVYAAGEAPIAGADGGAPGARACPAPAVVAAVRRRGGPAARLHRQPLRDGDVVITMGAGSIGGVPVAGPACRIGGGRPHERMVHDTIAAIAAPWARWPC